jgi:hypothetical protein
MKIRQIPASLAGRIAKYRATSAISAGDIPSFWWAGEKNFGDLVTPYLIEKITGHHAINVSNLNLGSVNVLCSTGSILHGLQCGNYTVWGSGFIEPLAASQAHPKVHVLRGPLSGEVAADLGWESPGKYGDPALLLPLLLPADAHIGNVRTTGKIVVIPHYALLDATKSLHPDVCIVSPMQDVEQVVPSIANAELVVSSSLHGLIVAQAYRRPWVWLRDHRNALYGGDFKFHDFFSSLGISPPSLECNGEITSTVVDKASKMAALAPTESFRSRQRDLLYSAPDILDTPVLSEMKAMLLESERFN